MFSMLDIVSFKPSLTIFEQNRYKTLFGMIVGAITIISIAVLCGYFTIVTFLRSEVFLIYNVSRNVKSVNLTNSPLMISLTDPFGNLIPEIYQEIRINMWTNSHPGNSTYNNLTNIEIPLEPCNLESFGEFASLFTVYNYTEFKCIPYQKYNLTLFGVYNSPSPQTFISIVVNMCNNKTMNNTCPDQSVIAPMLKNVYLHMLYVDYTVDNYNYDNPIQPYVKTEGFPINWDLAARYIYQFSSLSYITDVGSVFEDNKLYSSYAYSNTVTNVQIRHGSALYPGLTIGTVMLTFDTQGEQYNRSYPKLQTLLARVGGAVQGIMVLSQAICYLITKNMFLVHMINSNFCYDVDELEPKKITKLNKIEFSHSSNMHLSNVLERRRKISSK